MASKLQIDNLICAEVKRLSERYNKDYLDIKDLMQIMGLGRDKIREIMNSKEFPSAKYGKKKTVNIISFVTWQFMKNINGDIYD